MKKINKNNLKTILTVLFVSCFLISNILSSKQMVLPFGTTMTCAIFVFPVTYTLSDVFSEVYGYKWSRTTCYLAFFMNLLMVMLFEISIKTTAPSYWLNQEAFKIVLGSVPKVLFASLIAFVCGDFANDKVFQKMKQKSEKDKGFCERAIFSSVVGELVDSCIFIPIAFLGEMPLKNLLIMGITQILLKVSYEIIVLPITRFIVKKIKVIENE